MTDESRPADRRRVGPLWPDGSGTFATRCLQVIVVLALAAAVVRGALQLSTVVVAVLIALILACAFDPLTRLLEPLTVLVFVTAFIPIVGATLAGAVAALVTLVFNGWVVALVVVGTVILVNQLEGNLLQPLIMSRSLSLHPLVILLALTAGTVLGGIVGAILSSPTASVVWSAIKAWNPPPPRDDLPVEAVQASGHGS